MIVGVIGTFLLLIVALLGRWSRSTKLAAGRSAEFRPRVSGEIKSARAKMLVAGLVVLLAWMVGATLLVTPVARLPQYN